MLSNALVRNQIVFVLSGLPLGFDPSTSISNLTFQYGTSFDEPSIRVPAPGSALIVAAASAIPLRRRRCERR